MAVRARLGCLTRLPARMLLSLHTGYPEAQSALDYEALQLRSFYAGALVWTGGAFHRVADPLRHFADGLASLPNPVGSVADKINVGVFRWGGAGGGPRVGRGKAERWEEWSGRVGI
jgi:hypothetical protein